MPRSRTPPPPDILDAIRLHLAAVHGIDEVDLAEIGRPRSRSPRMQVTWDDGPAWTDAWFRCRRCPDGFSRYLVEVDRDQPTHRMLSLIHDHFVRDDHPAFHGVGDLGTRSRTHAAQLAIYTPPHAHDGASLVCRTCQPHGRNPVMLTPPPYGDARRLGLIQRRRTDLAQHMQGWPTRDQAVTLNALDQNLIDKADPAAARRALAAAARRERPRRPPSLLARALMAVMKSREDDGEPIERIIGELALLSKQRPVEFACQVGEGLIALGVLKDQRMRAADRAERVRQALDLPIGQYPTTSRRSLYRYRREHS